MNRTPDLARTFTALHHDGILVLPNAWDVASARIFETCGARAVATTSAGVAWAHGRADGNVLSREAMLASTRAITAAVGVPVSIDIESGFGTDDADIADTVRAVLDAGAVGVNLEDQVGGVFRTVAEQGSRIAAIRTAADDAGIALYLNARTDTHLVGAGDLEETIERAHGYLAAGASGIFVPGVADPELIATLVAAIDAPLNILVGPGSPSVPDLARIGVRRVSAGSSIALAVFGHARRAATELLTTGTYTELDGGMGYGELNALFG